jgi:polar amino acid transport system substrate-binding protein
MNLRLLAAVAGCVCLAALPAASQEARTLRIMTEGAFPPFNYIENNEPQGFEIELGKALCAAMKADCVFVTRNWEGLIKGLLAKEYDAIMASLAITERRKARIAFSKPYYRIPAAFIARNDVDLADVSPAGLAGKRIGTTARSEHAAFIEERYPQSELWTYGKFDDANLDLLTERIDLVLGDRIALQRFLDSKEGKSCCRLVGNAPHDPAFYGEGVGVGLRKEDKELKSLFNKALDAIIADGTYDRIRAKYFPFDIKVARRPPRGRLTAALPLP